MLQVNATWFLRNKEGDVAQRKGCTHTYLHYNWPLQPFCQDYGLASHNTYAVCVNFTRKWRYQKFNVDSERQIFLRNFFMADLFTFRVFCQKSAGRSRQRTMFSYFRFDF